MKTNSKTKMPVNSPNIPLGPENASFCIGFRLRLSRTRIGFMCRRARRRNSCAAKPSADRNQLMIQALRPIQCHTWKSIDFFDIFKYSICMFMYLKKWKQRCLRNSQMFKLQYLTQRRCSLKRYPSKRHFTKTTCDYLRFGDVCHDLVMIMDYIFHAKRY